MTLTHKHTSTSRPAERSSARWRHRTAAYAHRWCPPRSLDTWSLWRKRWRRHIRRWDRRPPASSAPRSRPGTWDSRSRSSSRFSALYGGPGRRKLTVNWRLFDVSQRVLNKNSWNLKNNGWTVNFTGVRNDADEILRHINVNMTFIWRF